MKQKQKKKQNVNNKFNFDDEYIIGVSNSASLNKTKSNKNVKNKGNKNKSKNNVKTNSNTKVKTSKKSTPKAKTKIRANRITKIFLTTCLFVGAGCFLCLSPIFNVQEIIVEKNSILPADTVRSLSRVELYKNIFLINKSDVINNIKENAYISDVKVQRLIPNKIRIVVEERTEKYLLQFAEGKYTVLDGQGYVLRVTNETEQVAPIEPTSLDEQPLGEEQQVQSEFVVEAVSESETDLTSESTQQNTVDLLAETENLIVLTGAETKIEDLVKVKGNQNRLCEADLKKLDNVTKIVQTTKNYEVFDYITKIDISDENNIKLILDGEGKIVHLGSCSDINTRILYMKEILNTEKGKNGEMFINGNLAEDKVFFRENV